MNPIFKCALIGEVDAGKSTTLGQILMQLQKVSPWQIEEVRLKSAALKKDFEPAFLLDAFEFEQNQEMTVDVAITRCEIHRQPIHFMDTPGHFELTNKFIGEASSADFGLLIVDAEKTPTLHSLRHVQMLSQLGINDFGVIMNKVAEYESYKKRMEELEPLLQSLSVQIHFICPIQAKTGIGFSQAVFTQEEQNLFSELEQVLSLRKSPRSFLAQYHRSKKITWINVLEGNAPANEELFSLNQKWTTRNQDFEECEIYGSKDAFFENLESTGFLAAKAEEFVSTNIIHADLVTFNNYLTMIEKLDTPIEVHTSLKQTFGKIRKVSEKTYEIRLESPLVLLKQRPRRNLMTLKIDGLVCAMGLARLKNSSPQSPSS